MKKMRIESAKGLIGLLSEKEAVQMCYRQIIAAIKDLRKAGIEADIPEIIIIDDKEYAFKDWMANE